MLVDLLVLEGCIYLAYLTRDLMIPVLPIAIEFQAYAGILIGVVMVPVAFYLLGLYPGYGLSSVERLRRHVFGTAIVLASLVLWDYLAQRGEWSRGILLATWLYATFFIPIVAALVRKIAIGMGIWGTPVVLVGAREAGRRLINMLQASRDLGLVPVAIMDFDERNFGKTVDGVPIVGSLSKAEELRRIAKTCVVIMPELDGGQLASLSAQLQFPHVVLVPELRGLQSSWVTARDLGGVLGIEVKKNLLLTHNRVLKRIMDYVITIPLVLFTAPLIAFLCLAIFIISPGNPFYSQQREGMGGRTIRMLKLRTMRLDADRTLERYLDAHPAERIEWNRYFKLKNDPRVLPVIGNFMRQSSLDELPQLWNILSGSMSLVGPRPFPYYHLEKFDDDFRALRRSVKPGLTGLWQVEYRSDGDVEIQQEIDTYYIRNWSLWLDILILFRTFDAVLSGKGAR